MIDHRNCFYRPRRMHLCPFCGAILHEVGGGIDKGLPALVIGACLYFFLIMAEQ